MKIAVIYGGSSTERELSLNSGRRVYDSLVRLGYSKPILIDFDTHFARNIDFHQIDAAFLAIQGTLGEDGCLQGLLECARIPYTHSGVLASAMGMNKNITSILLKAVGIPCPEYKIFTPKSTQLPKNLMNYPYVVKPVDDGSSFGISLIMNPENPELIDARLVGREMMANKYIEGQELTVGVLGDKALGVLEIKDFGKLYEYYDKYVNKDVKMIYPANIPADIEKKAMEYAEIAHKALGCKSISRVDFRYNSEDQGLYVLEVNTNPGFSERSMFPKLAEHKGIEFDQLVEYLISELKQHKNYKAR